MPSPQNIPGILCSRRKRPSAPGACGKRDGDDDVLDNVVDRFAHGFGLVVHQVQFESFGEGLLDFVHALDDAFGNLHHVRVGTFLDIERYGVLPVEARSSISFDSGR